MQEKWGKIIRLGGVNKRAANCTHEVLTNRCSYFNVRLGWNKKAREVLVNTLCIEITFENVSQCVVQVPCALLCFRVVITTPQRSKTLLNLFSSRSRSVLPVFDLAGIIASFTDNWIISDCRAFIQ